MKILRAFLADESGATALEYVLIASIISVAIIVGAGVLGTRLNTVFNDISTPLHGPAA